MDISEYFCCDNSGTLFHVNSNLIYNIMEVIVRIMKVNPWTGLTKWPTTFDYVGPYWTRSGNIYTGLSTEDARRLEKALNKEEGELSPNSDFWTTFAVKLGKRDLILDTDKPLDELQYLFLKGHKRVADGLANMNPSKDYVLINKDSEAEQANRINKIKREAYRELDKMSIEDMRKCLRLYGMKSDTMSNELVEAKLTEQVETAPDKFMLKWVNNPNKEINFVIEEAIAKNIIRKNRTQYFFGTDLIGNGIDDVIAYLNNKKNQDIRIAIQQEIKSK